MRDIRFEERGPVSAGRVEVVVVSPAGGPKVAVATGNLKGRIGFLGGGREERRLWWSLPVAPAQEHGKQDKQGERFENSEANVGMAGWDHGAPPCGLAQIARSRGPILVTEYIPKCDEDATAQHTRVRTVNGDTLAQPSPESKSGFRRVRGKSSASMLWSFAADGPVCLRYQQS